jgi:hypothetical protein
MGDYLAKVLAAIGQLADELVPVAKGSRTAISALTGVATVVLPVVLPLIPAPYGPAIAAAIPAVQSLVAVLTPLFAVAHVTRAATPAK